MSWLHLHVASGVKALLPWHILMHHNIVRVPNMTSHTCTHLLDIQMDGQTQHLSHCTIDTAWSCTLESNMEDT